MNKIEKDALNHRLWMRLQLVEELAVHIAIVGQLVRQIEAHDKKTVESFKGVIDFPAEFTGFRAHFDKELAHQVKEGDPVPGSFLASVAAPRPDLAAQYQQIHAAIVSGEYEKGETSCN